jgi:alpha-tubulin suppressor-like RCC1 family protein
MSMRYPTPTLALCAAAALAACGGGTDLSVSQQDISFQLAIAPQPPVAQGSATEAAVQVEDDDSDAGDPANRERFSAAVDMRTVEPLPPGVTVDFTRTPLRPGEAAALVVRAATEAQAGRHQVLVSGQISGGSTTRFVPHAFSIVGNCSRGTEEILHVVPSSFGRTVSLGRDGSAYLWGANRLVQSDVADENPVPETIDFYTAQRIDAVPAAISAASKDGVTAFVLADSGRLLLVSRYYRSAVRAPLGRAGWFTHTLTEVDGFRQVVATDTTFYALRVDGTVWSFPAAANIDADGGLRAAEPRQVAGLAGIAQLAAGGRHLLARTLDRTLFALGTNESGQLGDGSAAVAQSPIPVPGVGGVIDIAAGGAFSLAVLESGTVLAWGRGAEGQLGNGFSADRGRPVEVVTQVGAPLSDIIAVAAGARHALALRADAAVFAWGNNAAGQLGDGSTSARPFAQQVERIEAYRVAAAGDSSYIVPYASGRVAAWGDNGNGRLGDGTAERRHLPVEALGVGRPPNDVHCREREGPAPVVFEDTEFASATWQAIVTATPIDGPLLSTAQAQSGGHPDAYRTMTHIMQRPLDGELTLQIVHLKLDAVYTPAARGAIDRIDYREDRIRAEAQPLQGSFAFQQGDRLFVPNVPGDDGDPLTSQWTTARWTGLRADRFVVVAGEPCPPATPCPDFSASGAPITFGYFRQSSAGRADPRFSVTHGIDNWRVTVFRQ